MSTRIVNAQVTGKDGFKGQTFNLRLTGCDVVAGPMGSGKSSRLDAFLAGIRGLADKSSDTTRPYLGPVRPKGIVALTVDDNSRERVLRRDLEKGSRTTECKASDTEAATILGAHVTRCDLADFADGTDAVRRVVLDGVCRAAGVSGAWDRDAVLVWLGERLDLDVAAAAREYAAAKAAAAKAGADEDAVHGAPGARLLYAKPIGAGVADWLPGAIEWAGEEYTATNRAATRAAAHATTVLAQEGEAPAGTFAATTQALADADAALAAARSAVNTAAAAKRITEQHAEEVARHTAAVGRAQAEVDAAKAAVVAAAAAKTTAAAELDRLRPLHVAAKAEAGRLRPATAPLAEAVEAAKTATRAARKAADAAAGAVQSIEQLMARTEGSGCVDCGSADPLGLSAEVARLTTALAELTQAAEDAGADETLATRKLMRAQDAAKTAALAEGAAREALHVAEDAAAEADKRLKAAEERATRAAAALTAAEADLVSAGNNAPQLGGTAGRDDVLQATLEAAEATRDAAAAARDAHLRHQEREVGRQNAVTERERLAADHAAVKALGLALKDLQSEVARSAYGPILDAANAFLAECRIDAEVYINSESDFGAVLVPGWKPDSRPVPVVFWSLSDGERSLVGIALAVAFARLSGNPWIGLVIDRLERLDGVVLPRVLEGCARMVADGRLGNFLGAVVANERPVAPEGVEVHWLGAADAAVAAR